MRGSVHVDGFLRAPVMFQIGLPIAHKVCPSKPNGFVHFLFKNPASPWPFHRIHGSLTPEGTGHPNAQRHDFCGIHRTSLPTVQSLLDSRGFHSKST